MELVISERRRNIVKETPVSKERLSCDITRNKPFSQATFDKFPPDKFPIQCTFFLSTRDIETVDKMKEALKILPSDDYRFQRKKHRSMDLVTVDIYLKNADSVRPVANAVKDKALFIDKVIGERQIFGRDLVEMSGKIIKGEGLTK